MRKRSPVRALRSFALRGNCRNLQRNRNEDAEYTEKPRKSCRNWPGQAHAPVSLSSFHYVPRYQN